VIVSEQEHEQQPEETSEEHGETMKDLDVPEEEGKDVAGGGQNVINGGVTTKH
jgi:hypothetical protein